VKTITAQKCNRSAAHFTVVSAEIAPEEICERLGIKADSVVLKDTPNLSGNLQRHPFNMVIFRSQLSDAVDMDKHVEDILTRILPVRRRIMNLPKNCAPCFHFNYKMTQQGGWRLSPSIVLRLAKLGVECLFSLDLGDATTVTKRRETLKRTILKKKNGRHGE